MDDLELAEVVEVGGFEDELVDEEPEVARLLDDDGRLLT